MAVLSEYDRLTRMCGCTCFLRQMDHTIGDMIEIMMVDVDGSTSGLYCTDLGDGLYRIDGIPLGLNRLNPGDVVHATPKGDELVVRDVAKRSGWTTSHILPTREDRGSEWLKTICAKVEAFGGLWSWYCGFLVISLPPDIDYDPMGEVPSGA